MQMTIAEIMQIVGQLYIENFGLKTQVQELTLQIAVLRQKLEATEPANEA